MDGAFDKLEELIYVESHLSQTSAKFYGGEWRGLAGGRGGGGGGVRGPCAGPARLPSP